MAELSTSLGTVGSQSDGSRITIGARDGGQRGVKRVPNAGKVGGVTTEVELLVKAEKERKALGESVVGWDRCRWWILSRFCCIDE